MSILRLRLNIPLEGIPRFGVLSNIYDLSDKRKSKRDIIIPIGTYQDYYDVKLDPGNYIIEVMLPSGQVLNEEVAVKKSRKPQELYISAGFSPHEWLSWQQFIGNVEYENYKLMQEKPYVEIQANLVSITAPLITIDDKREVSDPNKLVSQGYFFKFPSLTTVPIDSLSGLSPFNNLNIDINFGTKILETNTKDNLSEVHSFGPEDIPYFVDGESNRKYIFVRGANIPTQYCVLPIPWMVVDIGENAVVEVLIYHVAVESSKIDSGYRLSVVVRDNLLGSILGYLGSGNLPTAAKIMDYSYAKEMLFLKMQNPLAAAAGAYVLLKIETGQDQRWHQWIRNLKNRFKWLPDGAIQHAWTILTKQNISEDEKKEARASLLEGYRRGIPFYSIGVKLLLDGLRLFDNDAKVANENDTEVEEALKLIWQLASRTNMRQPFTTVIVR